MLYSYVLGKLIPIMQCWSSYEKGKKKKRDLSKRWEKSKTKHYLDCNIG